MQAALCVALQALFRHHSVCSLENIRYKHQMQIAPDVRGRSVKRLPRAPPVGRKWLKEYPNSGPAEEAGKLPDAALGKAVLECENLTCIRGSYFLGTVGVPEVDAFRQLLVNLLKASRQIKRWDISSNLGCPVESLGIEFSLSVLPLLLMPRRYGSCLAGPKSSRLQRTPACPSRMACAQRSSRAFASRAETSGSSRVASEGVGRAWALF